MAADSATLIRNNLQITTQRRPAIISFIEPPENISRVAQKLCSLHGLFIHDIIRLNLLNSLMHVESKFVMKNRDRHCREKERSMFEELAEYDAVKPQTKRRNEKPSIPSGPSSLIALHALGSVKFTIPRHTVYTRVGTK